MTHPSHATDAPADREPRGRVVLGVDGSPASVEALRWATAEARARRCALVVVTCWPDPESLFVHEVPGHFCAPRHQAVEDLRRLLDEAAGVCEGVDLTTSVVNAHPVDALVSRCSAADLLVVGASRRRGGRRGPGVDQLCSMHAPCPVVVVESAVTAAGS